MPFQSSYDIDSLMTAKKMPTFELIRKDVQNVILRLIIRASTLKQNEKEQFEQELMQLIK